MLTSIVYNIPAMELKAESLNSRFIKQMFVSDTNVLLEQHLLKSVETLIRDGRTDEQLFLNDMVSIVEKRITDGSFDFNQLANEMKISKATLQRKVNQLIGLTPCRLIYSFRIEIARQLLLNSSLNIAEVAYRVGFNDPKYFSRRFRKDLGLMPREYRELMKGSMDSVDTGGSNDSFLSKVLVKLESRMSDGNLSFDQFASEMNMSKASLYRKLKSVSGLSPCEFIRSVRIKRSSHLLAKRKNVADVAFEVGFNDSKYFSRCFKSEFGVTPTQYQEQLVC